MKYCFFLIAVFSTIIFACNQSNTDTNKATAKAFDISNVRSQIAENNKAYGEAVANRDSNKLAGFYAADANVYAPDMPAMRGREGVKAFAGAFTNLGVKALTLETTDVYGDSSMVVEEGTYSTDYGNGKAAEKGKYLVVWKPENGQWKMYRDIFNADAPPAK